MSEQPRRRSRTWFARLLSFLAAAAVILGPRPSSAAGKVPQIAYVFPPGAQRGKTIEAVVGGLNLKGVQSIRVTGSGVEARVVKGDEEKALRLSVAVAPDAGIGERDLRVIGPGGISNRFRFSVGELPEVVEAEPNSRPAQAQPLESLPVLVNGQILAADRDIFRFSARAGETLVCEVRARSILPYIADAVPGWVQSVIALSDAAGKELAYMDDFRFKPDPVLIYPIEKDGVYLIEIRDALYRGREDFVYRLRLGALPYITDIYPLGARRGSTAQVELRGANLSQRSLGVELGPDAPVVVPVGLAGGASNALPFAAGDLEETAEAEPNDSPPQATKVRMPITVNGRIQRPGDQDLVVMTALAGERVVVEVRARRLNSPLDSIVTVLDAQGRPLAKNDDAVDEGSPLVTHHADSRLVHAFPAAGEYWIRIEDVQGKGGEEYAYRLSIAPPRPDFTLLVSPDNIRIAPGDTAALTAHVLRRDGFDGEVRLSSMGLPEGFTAQGAVIPAGESSVLFTITAPPGAAAGIHAPSFVGSGTIAGQVVEREARPVEEAMQAFSYTHRVPTRELLLAVVEPPPFTLSVVLPPGGIVDVPLGGEAQLAMKVVRADGVKVVRTKTATGPIRLAADTPAKGLQVRGAAIPADKDEAVVTLIPTRQAREGLTQNLILAGSLRAGKETLTVLCPAVTYRIVAAAPAAAPPAATLEATREF